MSSENETVSGSSRASFNREEWICDHRQLRLDVHDVHGAVTTCVQGMPLGKGATPTLHLLHCRAPSRSTRRQHRGRIAFPPSTAQHIVHGKGLGQEEMPFQT